MKLSRKIQIALLVFSFLIFSCSRACGQETRQNITILDTIAANSIDDIFNKVSTVSNFSLDTVYFNISDNEADWLIRKYFVEKFRPAVLIYSKEKKNNFIDIAIQNIGVKYDLVENKSEPARRELTIELFVTFFNKNNEISNFEVKKTNSDTLSYDQLAIVNSSNFRFAKAEIPKRELSFWNKYLEPAIAIVSTAIVTTLFFTVRTK